MDEKKKHRVLVCPLGWGLGHASRDIPIIDYLQKKGHDVIIAGDELQIRYISSYFPDIKTIKFPSFKVKLSRYSNQVVPIIGIAFRLPYYIIKEHFALKSILKDYEISLIISDNRYGLWHRRIKSALITHQIKVLFPKPFRFLEPVGELFVRIISQMFTQCWIPDFSGDDNLGGILSHPKILPKNARYIGLLSRFQSNSERVDSRGWNLVGVASGPSPQREIFIELIAGLAKRNNLKTLIIKGAPSEGTKVIEKGGVFYAGHLHDVDFQKAILSTKYLVSRAGYSTIMDLTAIGVNGLIVPTPGQTEQEYLAKYLSGKGMFKTCKQCDLESIDISIATVKKLTTDFPEVLFDYEVADRITADITNSPFHQD